MLERSDAAYKVLYIVFILGDCGNKGINHLIISDHGNCVVWKRILQKWPHTL